MRNIFYTLILEPYFFICTLVSGETLEIELKELKTGLEVSTTTPLNSFGAYVFVFKEIRTELKEFKTADKLPGDKFEEVMSVSITDSCL